MGVLQATGSGILGMNLLGHIGELIEKVYSQLLRFVLSFGIKFNWSNRIGESWKCLILLTVILLEKRSNFYSRTINISFQNMRGVPSMQVHALMKTIIQVLFLQELALLPSLVQTLIQFDFSLPQLKLHSIQQVVASSAATYPSSLQHGCDTVASQDVEPLLEELEMLKGMLGETRCLAMNCDGFQEESGSEYEMAAEYVATDDDNAAILDLKKATLEGLNLHDSVMKEWSTDPNKKISANPAIVKYTDFVLGTAQRKVEGEKGPGQSATPFENSKIAAYTIGAMIPCMRLYAHLGKELQLFLPHDGSDHPYKKWIDYYSSKTFEAEAVQIEELLDRLSVPLTGEELDLIEKLYRQAMKLEQLANFEKHANSRAVESVMLRGVNLDDIKSAASQVA